DYFQNPVVETITITRPLEEFCASGRCTYSVPSAFLKHLKNEHCEAAWHAPEEGFLANPSQPTSLQYPAVEVKPESLVTKKHIDGLWIDIRCLDTNVGLYIFLVLQHLSSWNCNTTTNTVPSTMSEVSFRCPVFLLDH
ncbi:hypothetical protein NFI96_023050, partial [Prochilodus magdalenae]